MTDTMQKLTGGQKFMAELEAASKSKEELLAMARDTIRNSHTKRTFRDRELPEGKTALDMRATFALAGLINKKDLSTDQRLILIKQRYEKRGYGDFDKDFKTAYPQEYGINRRQPNINNMMLAAHRQMLRY